MLVNVRDLSANVRDLRSHIRSTPNQIIMYSVHDLSHIGVYRRSEKIRVFMDIKAIPELHVIIADESTLTFGGNVSLTDFMDTLNRVSSRYDYYEYAKYLAKHIDLMAHVPVRNVSII